MERLPKERKVLFVLFKELLCVLCVSAVKMVLWTNINYQGDSDAGRHQPILRTGCTCALRVLPGTRQISAPSLASLVSMLS